MAERNPDLWAHCHRCKRAVGEWPIPKDQEPLLCGPCRHEIFNSAGGAAVVAYMKLARDCLPAPIQEGEQG
jgi:hypothetical protein